MSNNVRILLATYQGSAYLRPLLDSLLAQDHKSLEIIASDDGSADGSALILEEYAAKYPDLISHHRSGRRFGCSQDHFLYLLRRFGDAPYIMFCDQDDVWHPNKVSVTLRAMTTQCPDPSVPTVVHTDLRVVDRDLHVLHPSFLQFSSLDGSRVRLHQLLVQNVVTGCTMMVNRSLVQLLCSADLSGPVLMHDWYLALLASACGKVIFLNQATIDYRQHGNNVVGAKNARSLSYLLNRLKNHDARAAFLRTAGQARSLLDAYGSAMPPEAQELCRTFSALPDQPKLSRLSAYSRYGLYKQSLPRRIGQILWW